MAEGMSSRQVWIWVGVAVAVIVVVAGIWYFAFGNKVAVPDVVGMPAADAVHELQDAGLKLGETSQKETTASVPGTVLSETPAPGTKVNKNTTINIEVAQPQALVTVPNVTSQEASRAADAIRAAGLVPVVYSAYNPSTPAGAVFGQVPAAGTRAAPGSEVALGVSLGKTPSAPKVPDVVGTTVDQASSALTQAGFGYQRYDEYSDKVAAGTVIAQLPAGGAEALPGSTVAIEVSKGKAPTPTPVVSVPSVVGKSQTDATNALQNAGLGVNAYSEFSDTVPRGDVVGQLPVGGAKVERGTLVGIEVSKGKASPTVTVPDVTGKPASEATAALDAAGLKTQIAEEYSDTVAKGTVIAQVPVSGSVVPPDSLVVLEVSKGAKPTPTPY